MGNKNDYYSSGQGWTKTLIIFVVAIIVVAICLASIWGLTGSD